MSASQWINLTNLFYPIAWELHGAPLDSIRATANFLELGPPKIDQVAPSLRPEGLSYSKFEVRSIFPNLGIDWCECDNLSIPSLHIIVSNPGKFSIDVTIVLMYDAYWSPRTSFVIWL
jgi:hypothetical protein